MLTKPETVRIATVADEPQLFWHLMNDMRDANELGLQISDRAVYDTLHACCTGELSVCGVIDGRDGPVASVGIRGQYLWFSEQVVLCQLWLFVIPEARGYASLWEDLFDFAAWHREDMSQKAGYSLTLENSVMSLDRLEAKRRLWRRRMVRDGGREMGHIFWLGGEDSDVRRQEQYEENQPDVDHDARQPSGVRRLQRPHSIG